MKTYISVLRGINVGGNRIIKMEALREMYQLYGFENVQTYIQSGNVIFQYRETGVKELSAKISQQIAKSSGFEVPVIVVEMNELERLVSDNPFTGRPGIDLSWMHVTFLSEKPDPVKLHKLSGEPFKNDEFRVIDKAIYLCCPDGYGKTRLTNGFFENRLNVNATTRNWKTTIELLNLALKYNP